ncbi:MAG TPA: nucleotidyltransferase domain-containing protein, partial [Vicinamibacterales bacterium]|nr:nucleotidyltransferase domain-containing protein [Vicinamibacterales bacterium]
MIEQLRSVFESDPRVAYALIFGSSVTGKAHAHSDVDVAIGMAGPHQLDTMELGALASRLEAAAGRRVDLVLPTRRRPVWRTVRSAMGARSSRATRRRSRPAAPEPFSSTSTSGRSRSSARAACWLRA